MNSMTLYKINHEDTVAVALRDIAKGTENEAGGRIYMAKDDILFGHKMALIPIKKGEAVFKYGNPIGHAIKDIEPGEWVHTHNLGTSLHEKDSYEFNPEPVRNIDIEGVPSVFEGYRRWDGSVGIRNEIWVIPTVSCVNHTAARLAELAMANHPELADGIYAFPHNAGCSQLGNDEIMTQNILSGVVKHPNAGGVLLVGLGCEHINIERFLPVLGNYDKSRIKTLNTQDVEDELAEGLKLIDAIADVVSRDKREQMHVSKLKLGMKCGGSDAFSGVTANPLCGQISNRLCGLGGTVILTEVPEMFGAEMILMNRAKDVATFNKVVSLINNFKQYYIDYGQPIYENPSPGNKSGGITTLEEKSLGCIQKGGSAVVTDTLGYGQKSTVPGLNLAIGPGNDNVSITNLLANGAQMLLFTTGRGNPLGTAIPAIKISSNSKMYSCKKRWIDFNAGALMERTTMDELSNELWKNILDVASGRMKTQNEINGYREIMIFKNGVML